jgi:hypothetical protein
VRVELGSRLADGRLKTYMSKAYGRLNVAAVDKPTDDDRAVLAELDREFAQRNERLASITGLDLSQWRTA